MVNRTNSVKFDWIPDIPDHRDKLYSVARATPLPDHVDIIGINYPIVDQGNIGACTGNSSAMALEISIASQTRYSRLMAYYQARAIRGQTAVDAGASIRDVMKGLSTVGVSTEATWPYIESKFATKPIPKAYTEAKALVTQLTPGFEYVRLVSLTDLKTALAAGEPVTFGFSVPAIFVDPSFNFTLTYPSATDQIVGGHAVVAVGYDDRPAVKFVWVRNSWSNQWGIKGYFKMTQDWFTNTAGMAGDMWVIRKKAV